MSPALTAAALAQLLVVGFAGPDGPGRSATLHHARVAVDASPLPLLAARLEVDGGAGEVEPLVDAWVGAAPYGAVELRLGWQRAPLGLASERSQWDVDLPDRPGVTRLAGDLRGPAATARAHLVGDRLTASAGVVRTGVGRPVVVTGRLAGSWGPLGLGIGGSHALDAAADVRLRWNGGRLAAGHQRGSTRLGHLARGSWIEAGQSVLSPSWLLVARGETLDDHAGRSNTGDARIWTGGLTVLLPAGLRAQALWQHREELDRGGVGVLARDDDRLLLTLALEAISE